MRGFDADTRREMAAKAYLRRHDSCKKGKEMYLSFDLWGLYMPDYPISKHTQSQGPRRIIAGGGEVLIIRAVNRVRLVVVHHSEFLSWIRGLLISAIVG